MAQPFRFVLDIAAVRGVRSRGPPSQFSQSSITFLPRYWDALPMLLHRGAPMAISILNDLLLFSILVTVVSGIVIAGASLI
jgi:hypothetical protein